MSKCAVCPRCGCNLDFGERCDCTENAAQTGRPAAEVKPVLKYAGAKWRLADWIKENLPPHEIYLEPFFGSGAVFFRKAPARLETINDIDGNVVNLFRVLREQPEQLAALIELLLRQLNNLTYSNI